MPQLTRLSRDQEARLERLIIRTGLERNELIEMLVANGLRLLEAEHFGEDDTLSTDGRTIDQLLRESGLGA